MKKTSDQGTPKIESGAIQQPGNFVHFIWAGGEKILNKKGAQVIQRWCQSEKENAHIILWVDINSYPEGIQNMPNRYRELFNDLQINVLTNIPITPQLNTIVLRDIGEYRDDLVAYEIDMLRPNYGASSDLLRYYILCDGNPQSINGYFDSDVKPGSHLLPTQMEAEVLYVEDRPQRLRSELPQHQQEGFCLDELGNDAFICKPNNSTMMKIRDNAKQNYNIAQQILNFNHIRLCYGYGDKLNRSINRTGPGLIQMAVSNIAKENKWPIFYGGEDGQLYLNTEITEYNDSLGNSIIEAENICPLLQMHGQNYRYTSPEGNETNWLKTDVRKCANLDQALEIVMKTIAFEIKHFGILRLDDHIMDIAQALNNFPIGKHCTEYAEKLCERIEAAHQAKLIELDAVKLAQTTGLFTETLNLCQRNRCCTIFNLQNDGLRCAFLEMMASTPMIQTLGMLESAFKRGDLTTPETNRDRVLMITYERILIGIEILERQLDNIERYSLKNFDIICSLLLKQGVNQQSGDQLIALYTEIVKYLAKAEYIDSSQMRGLLARLESIEKAFEGKLQIAKVTDSTFNSQESASSSHSHDSDDGGIDYGKN